jgi:hypothetical protein
MKICVTCNKEIKSRRSTQCDSCYHKEWYAINKPPPKIKERSPVCKDCGKDRERHGRSVIYCNWCALKRAYAKRPGSLEKRNIQARNYNRMKKGIPIDLPPMRAKNGNGHLNKHGYRIICKKGHVNAITKKGNIGEHTYIMSQNLGRPLKKGESVHHINGVRDDNQKENLELWHRGQPPGQRLEDKLDWAKEFLEEYGYTVSKSE